MSNRNMRKNEGKLKKNSEKFEEIYEKHLKEI